MIVELKPTECALAAQLAAVRQTVNLGSGVRDKQMGTDDGYKIGVDGLVAELAVCKHFNVMPDLSFVNFVFTPALVVSSNAIVVLP